MSAPLKGCTCPDEKHDIFSKTCTQSGLLYSLAGTEGQLAPEVHNKFINGSAAHEGYHGEPVDVFNAGIVLFNLLFATGPFFNAAQDDYYYQHIARNEGMQFWNK
jgi:hypothetical protein